MYAAVAPDRVSAFDGSIAFVRETTLAALVDETVTSAQGLAPSLMALDATVGQQAALNTPANAARR